MVIRTLRWSGLKVSTFSLGTMEWGGKTAEPYHLDEAFADFTSNRTGW